MLPTGFMKVRYFGFFSPSFAMSRNELKARVEMTHGFAEQRIADEFEPPGTPAPLCCPHCGRRLRYRRTILPLRVPPSAEHPLTTTMPAPG